MLSESKGDEMKLSLISSRKPHFDPFSSVWTAMQACELANCAEIDALTVFTLKTTQNISKCIKTCAPKKSPARAPKKSPAASFRNRPPFIVKVKRNPSSFCLHCRTDGVKPFREKYVHQQRLTRYQTPNSKMNSRRLAKETIKMNFPIVNIIEKIIKNHDFRSDRSRLYGRNFSQLDYSERDLGEI